MTLAVPPTGPVGRVVFLGTPEEAALVLRRLVAAGIEVVCAVTRPDARRGRGSTRSPSPVAAAATELGVPVAHDHAAALDAHAGVLGVVVAYGVVLPVAVLERHALVNLHFSLLPRWRGAAPVERAILAGDSETGVCLMRVVESLDEGEVFDRRTMAIAPTDTAADLRRRLASEGADMLVASLRAGLGAASPQLGEATYARKIRREDREIDWRESAEIAMRRVRVGGANAVVGGHEVRVLDATLEDSVGQPGAVSGPDGEAIVVRCATGSLRILRLQPPGGRAMRAADWWRGRR